MWRNISLFTLLSLVLAFGVAWAHKDEAALPASQLAQQALTALKSNPPDLNTATDKLKDTLDSQKPSGVNLELIRLAQQAVKAGVSEAAIPLVSKALASVAPALVQTSATPTPALADESKAWGPGWLWALGMVVVTGGLYVLARRTVSINNPPSIPKFAPWQLSGIAGLRIVFGLVWAVDAWFKWQPTFFEQFVSYLMGAHQGQPPLVSNWIGFWVNVVKVDPHVFAHLVALGETALAVGLIFGLFSNVVNLAGILLSLVIWSTAEGLGGPYTAGSVDIGSAIIYVLVFVGLYFSRAGLYLGMDSIIGRWLGRYSWLASGAVGSKSVVGTRREAV
ncbi:MAG: DoxX family protein [Thermaceae bacterium]|nr:DoxX family protein [Thermaceae bacterium]